MLQRRFKTPHFFVVVYFCFCLIVLLLLLFYNMGDIQIYYIALYNIKMLLYLDHRAYVCEDKECFRSSNTYSLKQKPRIAYRTKRENLLSSDSHTAAEIVVLQKF